MVNRKFINQKVLYNSLEIYLLSSINNSSSTNIILNLTNPRIIYYLHKNSAQLINIQENPYKPLSIIHDSNNSVTINSKNDILIDQSQVNEKSKIRQKKSIRIRHHSQQHRNIIKNKNKENLFLVRPIQPLDSKSDKNSGRVSTLNTPVRHDTNLMSSSEYDNSKIIIIQNPITIHELASLIFLPESEIIKWLFLKGIKATINELIDINIAISVAKNYGFIVQNSPIIEKPFYSASTNSNPKNSSATQLRAPIITVLGHIDHGKTTLLNVIRKKKLIQEKIRCLTQLIKVYETYIDFDKKNRKMIFLDTPGHEAFVSMRSLSMQITDLVILVIAGDSGLGLQTIEVIEYIKKKKLPTLIAISKIDKPDVNINRIKKELSNHGVIAEKSESNIDIIPISSITGQNIDVLLSSIVKMIDSQDLRANPFQQATGIVVDAYLDKNKGPVANVIIQNGTLHVGDFIIAEASLGKVRAMKNNQNLKQQSATPSSAVEIWGLSQVPIAGSKFLVAQKGKEVKKLTKQHHNIVKQMPSSQKHLNSRITVKAFNDFQQITNIKQVNIILKTDTQGSVEALLYLFMQIPQQKIQLNVMSISTGMITETNVKLALTTSSYLMGFNATVTSGARFTAKKYSIMIHEHKIIYDLLANVQNIMVNLLDPEYTENCIGTATVHSVFSLATGTIAGCIVSSGSITRNSKIRVIRNKSVIHEGELKSLKYIKEDIEKATEGNECGISVLAFEMWKVNDNIKCYNFQHKTKSLN